MFIKHCILGTFLSSVKLIQRQITHVGGGGVQTHKLCIAEADVLLLDHRASQVARGSKF